MGKRKKSFKCQQRPNKLNQQVKSNDRRENT